MCNKIENEILKPNKGKEGSYTIEFEELDEEQTKMEMLDYWFEDLVYPRNRHDFIEIDESKTMSGREIYRMFHFYTENNIYSICAKDRDEDDGYLGCTLAGRKPLAGAKWAGGNDLPDGKFNKDTWFKIVQAIAKYELVRLGK